MKFFSAVALFFSAIVSFASPVKIAFLEFHRPDGSLVQLEKDGRFAHVAMSYEGQWLQADPYGGVRIISLQQLQQMGLVAEVLTVKNTEEPSEPVVKKYLGKAYDNEFSWSDDKIYCSELVAKILAIPPQPMVFDSTLWPPQYSVLNGKPGISPDKIYKYLLQSK